MLGENCWGGLHTEQSAKNANTFDEQIIQGKRYSQGNSTNNQEPYTRIDIPRFNTKRDKHNDRVVRDIEWQQRFIEVTDRAICEIQ